MQKEPLYGIKAAAQRSGLAPHVIRIWEIRYNAVSPHRTETNRRLYSEADVERLLLLRRATLAGHTIGQVAKLPTNKLAQIVAKNEDTVKVPARTEVTSTQETSARPHFEACLEAVQRLDADGLEAALARATVAFSKPVLIDQILLPLIQHVGELWREGTLRVMHEHLTTSVVRTVWGTIRNGSSLPVAAPQLIVTTPAGQMHELGALIAAAVAINAGWRVTYLGPNLPAEEISAAAAKNQAKAVALSLVYPTEDPHLENELRRLRHHLPEETVIIVGGRAAGNYSNVLEAIGAIIITEMPVFHTKLETLHTG